MAAVPAVSLVALLLCVCSSLLLEVSFVSQLCHFRWGTSDATAESSTALIHKRHCIGSLLLYCHVTHSRAGSHQDCRTASV